MRSRWNAYTLAVGALTARDCSPDEAAAYGRMPAGADGRVAKACPKAEAWRTEARASQMTPISWEAQSTSGYRRDQGVTGRSSSRPSTLSVTRSLKNAIRLVTSAASRRGSR